MSDTKLKGDLIGLAVCCAIGGMFSLVVWLVMW
jgi:hypothetical protein